MESDGAEMTCGVLRWWAEVIGSWEGVRGWSARTYRQTRMSVSSAHGCRPLLPFPLALASSCTCMYLRVHAPGVCTHLHPHALAFASCIRMAFHSHAVAFERPCIPTRWHPRGLAFACTCTCMLDLRAECPAPTRVSRPASLSSQPVLVPNLHTRCIASTRRTDTGDATPCALSLHV
eukprot:851772-Rhodomonas_salina.2